MLAMATTVKTSPPNLARKLYVCRIFRLKVKPKVDMRGWCGGERKAVECSVDDGWGSEASEKRPCEEQRCVRHC